MPSAEMIQRMRENGLMWVDMWPRGYWAPILSSGPTAVEKVA